MAHWMACKKVLCYIKGPLPLVYLSSRLPSSTLKGSQMPIRPAMLMIESLRVGFVSSWGATSSHEVRANSLLLHAQALSLSIGLSLRLPQTLFGFSSFLHNSMFGFWWHHLFFGVTILVHKPSPPNLCIMLVPNTLNLMSTTFGT